MRCLQRQQVKLGTVVQGKVDSPRPTKFWLDDGVNVTELVSSISASLELVAAWSASRGKNFDWIQAHRRQLLSLVCNAGIKVVSADTQLIRM